MTNEREQEILRWWTKYRSVRKVANRSGLSRGGVYRVLDKYSIPRPRWPGRPPGCRPTTRERGLNPNTLPLAGSRDSITVGEDLLLKRLHAEAARVRMRAEAPRLCQVGSFEK